MQRRKNKAKTMAEIAVIILVVGILLLGRFVNVSLKHKVYVGTPLILLFVGFMWLQDTTSFYPRVLLTVLFLGGLYMNYKNYRKELASNQEPTT
jgi:hypothetical protein